MLPTATAASPGVVPPTGSRANGGRRAMAAIPVEAGRCTTERAVSWPLRPVRRDSRAWAAARRARAGGTCEDGVGEGAGESAENSMTYVVTENCIKCKYMD